MLPTAVFLFRAILNLYHVTRASNRLGFIAEYMIAFALCVSLIPIARQAGIFGACIAYAVVIVVFVVRTLADQLDPNEGPSRLQRNAL